MKTDKWLRGTKQAEGRNEVQILSSNDRGFSALLAVFKKLTIPHSRQSLKHTELDFRGFYFVGKLIKGEESLVLTCTSTEVPVTYGVTLVAFLVTQALGIYTNKELIKFKSGGYDIDVDAKGNCLSRSGRWEFSITCGNKKFGKLLQDIHQQVTARRTD
jgi:hypothetical protein